MPSSKTRPVELTQAEINYLLRMTAWPYEPRAEVLMNKLKAASDGFR